MKNVAIVVTTHCTNPAVPATSLVETVLMDLFEKYPFMKDSPIYITCDKNLFFPQADAYLENLRALANRIGNCSIFFKEGDTRKDGYYYCRGNLRAGIIEAVSAVKEDIILFLEHDWFLSGNMPVEDIISCMLRYTELRIIRFDKTSGSRNGRVFTPPDSGSCPVLTRCNFSANPFLSTTKVWQELLIPKLKAAPVSTGVDGEFETALGDAFKVDDNTLGFEAGHTLRGLFIYGDSTYPPSVTHLNGNGYNGPFKTLLR